MVKLVNYMQRAKYYLQLSAHEGFGISMAEAMSCGCIPIGFDRGAIPEVISTYGKVVNYGNIDEVVKSIEYFEEQENLNYPLVSESIKNRFDISIRENELKRIIYSIKKVFKLTDKMF